MGKGMDDGGEGEDLLPSARKRTTVGVHNQWQKMNSLGLAIHVLNSWRNLMVGPHSNSLFTNDPPPRLFC